MRIAALQHDIAWEDPEVSKQVPPVGPVPQSSAERERDGHAHDEEEVREDQVGGGPTVPLRVAKGSVDVRPATRIVDEDHRGDGEASKRIERHEPARPWIRAARLRLRPFDAGYPSPQGPAS